MDPTMVRVKVFHQTRDDRDERRFQTGDPLREVVAFDLEMTENRRIPLPDRVWWKLVFNPRWGGTKTGWLLDYLEYQRRNKRHLRVGDVVVVGEQAWAIRDLVPNPSGQARFSPLPKWEPGSLMASEIVSDDGAA
jgi:hypothetical protein